MKEYTDLISRKRLLFGEAVKLAGIAIVLLLLFKKVLYKDSLLERISIKIDSV
jgi:hypothetical protein